MKSLNGLFTLDWKSVARGLIIAVLSGIALPVLAAIQTPGFDISTINWHGVWILALNGGLAGGAAYIVKSFFSDNQGQIFGKV